MFPCRANAQQGNFFLFHAETACVDTIVGRLEKRRL